MYTPRALLAKSLDFELQMYFLFQIRFMNDVGQYIKNRKNGVGHFQTHTSKKVTILTFKKYI